MDLKKVLKDSENLLQQPQSVSEFVSADPSYIIDNAKTQMEWDEFESLIWKTRTISDEFTTSLRKQQKLWCQEIYNFYTDAIQDKLLSMGFSSPNRFGRQMINTAYGCDGIETDTGGRGGSFKIVCLRVLDASYSDLNDAASLPYGSHYKQANWTLVSEEVSEILDPIWKSWGNRQNRLAKILSELEYSLVPSILAPA